MSMNFAPSPVHRMTPAPPSLRKDRRGDAPAVAPATAETEVTDRRRPRLLLSAARHGLSLYRRDRDLPRLLTLGESRMPPLDALFAAEARFETARRSGTASYSFARHIEVLIALLAELRLTLTA